MPQTEGPYTGYTLNFRILGHYVGHFGFSGIPQTEGLWKLWVSRKLHTRHACRLMPGSFG